MTTKLRNIILLVSIASLAWANLAYGKTASVETLQKCQLKGAQSLIKKYKLSALPLKIQKPEACGKSFCVLFEVIRKGSFKGNFLPIGATLYVCDGKGIQNVKRLDGKGLVLEHGLECKDSAEFSSDGRVSCTLNKPFVIQGFTLPVDTEIKCLRDYKTLASFYLKVDADINGNKLAASGTYTLKNSKIADASAKDVCK